MARCAKILGGGGRGTAFRLIKGTDMLPSQKGDRATAGDGVREIKVNKNTEKHGWISLCRRQREREREREINEREREG